LTRFQYFNALSAFQQIAILQERLTNSIVVICTVARYAWFKNINKYQCEHCEGGNTKLKHNASLCKVFLPLSCLGKQGPQVYKQWQKQKDLRRKAEKQGNLRLLESNGVQFWDVLTRI
jgi:hypothetical protein